MAVGQRMEGEGFIGDGGPQRMQIEEGNAPTDDGLVFKNFLPLEDVGKFLSKGLGGGCVCVYRNGFSATKAKRPHVIDAVSVIRMIVGDDDRIEVLCFRA